MIGVRDWDGLGGYFLRLFSLGWRSDENQYCLVKKGFATQG